MANDLEKLINQALAPLSQRQKEVIKMRFGLRSQPLTLAAIGDRYDITRERVRQIEVAALKTINQTTQAGPAAAAFSNWRQLIINHLKKFNGVRRHDLFCQDWKTNGSKLNFLVTALAVAQQHPEDDHWHCFWYLSDAHLEKASGFIDELAIKLRASRPLPVKNDPLTENYISLSKKFAFNPYGEFGLAEWRHINPRVSRDWAYLVIKKEGRPLHFTALAGQINKLRPLRRVNTQTIHNELIKDKRFVLVGRGTYGLSEFGIIPGTAREVLVHFINKHGPLPAKELIKMVMAQRVFKDKTLYLNLQNKKHFQRLANGRYTVREV